MRTGTVSYKLEDLKKGVIIPIGFVGENDFTRVIFDAEEIYKKYPSASVSMKVQPPKGVIYPAAVARDGNTVIWQVKEADVANRGGGELQLTFIDGETKIKTYIAKTDVKRSLAGNGPAPDPVQDWVDNAEEVLDDLAAMDNIAKTAEAGDIGKALSPKTVENGVVTEWQYVEPGAGTDDYTDLENKPKIGGVTLAGDKSLHDLGIAAESAIPDVSGKANLSVVAPAFDQATANDAGSLVTYTDGVVYVLPEGHTAGTTWANTQKTATNIAEQQRQLLNAIQGKYEKPSGGIPSTDMTQAVQDALDDAESAYQKPSGGIPASDIADGVIPVVDNALSDSSENAVQNKVVKGALDGKAPVIINIATGNPTVFNDGGGMPIKSLLIQFTPKQSGTGDPSPQNIRSILPWDGLKVWNGGKNLLPNKTFAVSGTQLVIGNDKNSADIPLKAGTYTLSVYCSKAVALIYKVSGGSQINILNSGGSTGLQFASFTLTADSMCEFYVYISSGVSENDIEWMQLEKGNILTPSYEPYKPITDTDISFPEPVYGGEHEAVSGKLLNNYEGHVTTWGAIKGNRYQSGYRQGIITFENEIPVSGQSGASATYQKCNIAKYQWDDFNGTSHFYTAIMDDKCEARIILPDDTPDETEIVVIAKLKTPQEQTLTGHQITALVGNNTIWSDADGSMTVEYPADTKTYIDNLIATAIASL